MLRWTWIHALKDLVSRYAAAQNSLVISHSLIIPEVLVQQQFFLIADELDWGVEAQIDRLETFVRVYGAAGRMDAELAGIGLSLQQPLHRESLRDAILRFIDRLGAQGAFSHFLYKELRLAREAAAVKPAEPPAPSVPARGGLGGLIRRWVPGRVRAAGRHPVS